MHVIPPLHHSTVVMNTRYYLNLNRWRSALALIATASSLLLSHPAHAGLFFPAGQMNSERGDHTATLLANGKVLVVGGSGPTRLASAELYDPVTGRWSLTGPLNVLRDNHTATPLPNGKVLVAGGEGYNAGGTWDAFASAEIYDPKTGTWTMTSPLNLARYAHTATLLPNGKVLVVGGEHNTGGSWSSLDVAELYDPAAGVWTIAAPMSSGRSYHTSTMLPNGKVLIAAGMNDDAGFLNLAELYDPATGTWTPTGVLSDMRAFHTATLLANGRVLIVGGGQCCGGFGGWVPMAGTELYDPASGTWTQTGMLNQERIAPAVSLLQNGRVLAAGGGSYLGLPIYSAEEYDPATGKWLSTGELIASREDHTATALPDGRVLVTGGYGLGTLTSGEVYDPARGGTWAPTGSLSIPRTYHATTLMTNGQVLVTGGWYNGTNTSATEHYDPITGNWIDSGQMNTPRENHTATLLNDGQVLVAGGWSDGSYEASAELYDPANGSWYPTGWLNQFRQQHSATLLQNGQVLVAGGFVGWELPDAELYDPTTQSWTPTGPMNTARNSQSATLLHDGRVLVAGGYSVDPSTLATVPLPDVELYDPANGLWTMASPMTTVRVGHTATLLPNGKVLVAGGSQTFTNFRATIQSSAELFDPATGNWTATAPMAGPRVYHIAVLLTNGLVLVAGGLNTYADLSSAELYDSASGTWSPAASMIITRQSHSAALLPNGQVLAIGGLVNSSPVASAELYDPGTRIARVPQAATIVSTRILSNGALRFAFTNTPAAAFSVLATTLPSLPSPEWMVLGGVTETSPGQYQFTDTQATNYQQRFYRLRSP